MVVWGFKAPMINCNITGWFPESCQRPVIFHFSPHVFTCTNKCLKCPRNTRLLFLHYFQNNLPFFTDILTCHSRKGVQVSQLRHNSITVWQDQWKSAIIHFIIYTCAFPTGSKSLLWIRPMQFLEGNVLKTLVGVFKEAPNMWDLRFSCQKALKSEATLTETQTISRYGHREKDNNTLVLNSETKVTFQQQCWEIGFSTSTWTHHYGGFFTVLTFSCCVTKSTLN